MQFLPRNYSDEIDLNTASNTGFGGGGTQTVKQHRAHSVIKSFSSSFFSFA
tara:strand:- start:102447 stop:102599 length:153 start_codon:yes stop_codon:yes gene_type:complete